MNRRAFVRSLCLTGAGAAVGTLGFTPRLFARVPGANARLRVGLVGFADRARQSPRANNSPLAHA